jgi:type I restriction enzyme M protein
MIECKQWSTFDKASEKMQKDGGQLFTYFQQDRHTSYLMLYTSQLVQDQVDYRNEIVKIEEDYRQAGNVKELYDRWSKIPATNGLFDLAVKPYTFKSKAIQKKELKEISQADSRFIFHQFLSILRKHVVSDKPNAFNKIFTLFLCKIIDEDRNDEQEVLDFQWKEGEDSDITFMSRLTDLYKRGMKELLKKEITDVSDRELDTKMKVLGRLKAEEAKEIKDLFTKIRLEKNNEFAFKEVFDQPSFTENTKVVKEIVQLLEGYQLRYNKKHQYLGDFFELLLTTGLKQESGQFFTPVPIAKYIVKSLPIEDITRKKWEKGEAGDLLPMIIDYAAGSGHFLVEAMEEVQQIIEKTDITGDTKGFTRSLVQNIQTWKKKEFAWAEEYIYGIEKDYRLVKTAKVSCFLHGDGLAKVIHGDGLASFSHDTPDYRGCERLTKKEGQDNGQFDIVIANPPYSVASFKRTMEQKRAKKDFMLFDKLTDKSAEIETLFVERTKQLLKVGGMAGIILPASLLTNTGIYTAAREMLLKYFEIVAITQLGAGTFMATGTNTVVLFLRRKEYQQTKDIAASVEVFFHNLQDLTAGGIENVFSHYVTHAWEGISFDDYCSLCRKSLLRQSATMRSTKPTAKSSKRLTPTASTTR